MAGPDATISLWRNRAFVRLWLAQVVSSAGSQVTTLALPLTAILVLGATPGQMGALGVAIFLPNLLVGLHAGVWVDRARRRPILIGADLGRAICLGSIPVAALLGRLTFLHLAIVGFAAGLLTVFFEVASTSILPSVVAGAQLVEANGALASSTAFLAIAGPGAAGGLIQLLGAPKAMIIDAASYVGSALALGTTGSTESVSPRLPVRGHMNAEIGEGLRALLRTPLLRALTASSSIGSFFLAVQSPVFVLFLTRELGFTAATLGLVFACGGGGTLLGALLAGRVAQRLGPGRAIVLGTFFGAVGGLCVPLAGFVGLGLPLVATGQVLTGLGASLYGVNQLSLRQLLTPPTLLGRVNAARRFLVFGTAPLGAAAGGVLGGTLGLRTALLVGAIGFVAALLLILCSPVRSVRDTVGLGA